MQQKAIHYRKDLQGLRAVAVCLVVAAHAGIPGIAGGFVGVDVFFVLSGYLITGLLADEYIRNGRIELCGFYARRIRRLLPAMLAMVAVTVIVSYWLLSKSEAYAMLASTPFAASWTSNLFFAFRELDYFDELGGRDLFLHTWSLGVEEQFYLIWPLLVGGIFWFAARRGNIRFAAWLFAGIVIVGAICCVVWTDVAAMQAFYLTPARIWQFALGGLVYIVFDRIAPVNSIRTATAMLCAGLAAITVSAVAFDVNVPYPGVRSVLPSLGAALVIAAGRPFSVNAWRNPLSDNRFVWIGDRSYSIYLWHWPVLTLGGALGFDHIATQIFGLLLLTLLLSMFSYRFVELPFWKGGLSRFASRNILVGGVSVVCLVFVGSLQALKVTPPSVAQQRDAIQAIRSDVPDIYHMGCDAWYQHARVEPCVLDGGDSKHTIVFVGDSIGAQWVSAFPELFPPPEWRHVILTKSACPMVDEDIYYTRIGSIYSVCAEWRNAVLDRINQIKPDVVLVGGTSSYDYDATQWVHGSRRVFSRLSESAEQVFVISGTPQLGIDGPGCIARTMGKPLYVVREDCRGKPIADWVGEVSSHLRKAASSLDNVSVIDMTSVVCPDGICSAITKNGIPVFRDSQHLADTFVRSRVKQFRKAMNAAIHP